MRLLVQQEASRAFEKDFAEPKHECIGHVAVVTTVVTAATA